MPTQLAVAASTDSQHHWQSQLQVFDALQPHCLVYLQQKKRAAVALALVALAACWQVDAAAAVLAVLAHDLQKCLPFAIAPVSAQDSDNQYAKRWHE
jgi:HD superfamily phosphohydrolase YqeK